MSKFHESGDHGIRHDDSPEELARKLYDDKDYFENNPRGYKNMSCVVKKSKWHDDAVRDFISAVPVRGLRVLDVGCATGVFMRPLMEAGADVYGIDLSKYAAAVAKKYFKGMLATDMERRVVCGSAHDLSAFEDRMFDLYFSVETMEHVPYRYHLSMIREARRVLRPGGVLYLQGQIGFKDYLDPDPNDDAGHIAVLPFGYWNDLLDHLGFRLAVCDIDLMEKKMVLSETPSWKGNTWRFLFGRKT